MEKGGGGVCGRVRVVGEGKGGGSHFDSGNGEADAGGGE